MGWVRTVVALVGLVVGVSVAHAEGEHVVLYDAPALRPDLCAALRIQLVDLATVTCVPDTRPDAPLAERIAEAARALQDERSALGVLLERDPAPDRVRMVLVGAQPDRALLAIEAIEDRPAPDIDRSLALKVRDTLETVVRARSTAAVPLAATLAPAPARPLHVRALLEAGAAAALGAHVRGAGVIAAAVRVLHQGWYGELALAGQLSSAIVDERGAARVREREQGASLALRAGRQWTRLALGALAEAEVLRMSAHGVTAEGTRGEQAFASARLGVGGDLRVLWHMGRVRVGLRLAPTLRVDPVAQRFALDHRTMLSVGRAELWLPLSFMVELPGGSDA